MIIDRRLRSSLVDQLPVGVKHRHARKTVSQALSLAPPRLHVRYMLIILMLVPVGYIIYTAELYNGILSISLVIVYIRHSLLIIYIEWLPSIHLLVGSI